ncbi:MAG: hypothetical protein Q9187_002940 [Circinaria calcarea]
MPSANRTTVTICLPPGSGWTSGLHWHESHVEFLQVRQGRAQVTLGNITRIYQPQDKVIRIEKNVIHRWRRPSARYDEEEDLVVEEWTEPADGQNEIFFRNLNSVILDAERTVPPRIPVAWWIEWQIMVICHGMDNYPVFVKNEALMRFVTHLLLMAAICIGVFGRLKPHYEEYTPKLLLEKGKKHA